MLAFPETNIKAFTGMIYFVRYRALVCHQSQPSNEWLKKTGK